MADNTLPPAEATEVIDVSERDAVLDAESLVPRQVFEIIRQDGHEEMERHNSSHLWSGIAAGIVISFSVICEAILRTYLPNTSSSYLIENFGYSMGFLLVILCRMQLFTENTITTVLPIMVKPSWTYLRHTLRVWGIVLFANVVGAFMAAAMMAHTSALPSEILPAIRSLSIHATGMPPLQGFMRAIPAGVLIAAIVWMMPQVKDSPFILILTFTWLIAAGDFTHIVAGSVEMAFLILTGDLTFAPAVFGFFLPVLAGNIVGGTVIFSMLAWAQIRNDIPKTAQAKQSD